MVVSAWNVTSSYIGVHLTAVFLTASTAHPGGTPNCTSVTDSSGDDGVKQPDNTSATPASYQMLEAPILLLMLVSFLLVYILTYLSWAYCRCQRRSRPALPVTAMNPFRSELPRVVGAQRILPTGPVRPLQFVNRGYGHNRCHFITDDFPPSYEELFSEARYGSK